MSKAHEINCLALAERLEEVIAVLEGMYPDFPETESYLRLQDIRSELAEAA